MNKKSLTILTLSLLTATLSPVQADDVKLNVAEAGFSKQLVSDLVSAYNQQSSDTHITLTETEQGDGRIVLQERGTESIGRFVVLPIANTANTFLSSSKAKKGLTPKLERQIFIERDELDALSGDAFSTKEIKAGTVFSLTGRKSLTSELLAHKYGTTSADIKGRKVVASDGAIISIIKKNDDAIGFNIPALIYNSTSRLPEERIAVLNVDLNGDGKVADEERLALRDVDSLVSYLENTSHIGRPVGNVNVESTSIALKKFVDWVASSAQQVVNSHGYLTPLSPLTAKK